MSEETQEIKEEQAPEAAETTEKTEAPAEAAPQQASGDAPTAEAAPEAAGDAPASDGAEKTKKINRISVDELNKKIKALEEKNEIHSKYYKHLVQRKNEMERAKA